MMWGTDTNPAWLWLYGLLSLATLVALIVGAVRYFRDDSAGPVGPGGPVGPAAPRRSDARRILDERFVRGELTPEQYREQVAELGEQP
jgi:putative membrane protein